MRNRVSILAIGVAALTGCTDDIANFAQSTQGAPPRTIDVAENMARFVFDTSPLFDDGMPAYGNDFVTEGYLYPAGHLDGKAGTLADGSPADPEAVIGEWTCRGVFVGNGVQTVTGPIVITTQLFDLYDEPGFEPGKRSGAHTLVTEGYEIVEIGAPVRRAITGGTGSFRSSRGEIEQQLLGFNASQGVNLRVHLNPDAAVSDDLYDGDPGCDPAADHNTGLELGAAPTCHE